MNISRETLISASQLCGFQPEILEKIAHLLNLLNQFQNHPFLRDRLILKGGTALNLFFADLLRLSIDIDLNYTGKSTKEGMLEERPQIEQAVTAVCNREGFSLRRLPEEHAGGKWALKFTDAFGRNGNLEIDINFMYRIPLWTPSRMDSIPVGEWQARSIPVLDFQELAAGKIAALLSRRKARDLFDSAWILRSDRLDLERLRIALIVYGAMNRLDWRDIQAESLAFDSRELKIQLLPTLRLGNKSAKSEIEDFGAQMVKDCLAVLTPLMRYSQNEKRFLDRVLDRGEIDPSLITGDMELQDRIRRQPMLEWKAKNVRLHKGQDSEK